MPVDGMVAAAKKPSTRSPWQLCNQATSLGIYGKDASVAFLIVRTAARVMLRQHSRLGIRKVLPQLCGSLCLDARELDHPDPPFDIVCNDLTKCSGGASKHGAAQFSNSCDDFRIGEARAHLFIKLVDNLGWCASRGTKPQPTGPLITGQEVSHGWDVWQHIQTSCGRHCQRAQPAGLDVLDRFRQ